MKNSSKFFENFSVIYNNYLSFEFSGGAVENFGALLEVVGAIGEVVELVLAFEDAVDVLPRYISNVVNLGLDVGYVLTDWFGWWRLVRSAIIEN